MTVAKPVRLRTRAVADVDTAVDYYRVHAGAGVAGRFIDSIERALTRIERSPQAGALRFGFELDIPGLRHVPLERFPSAVFYLGGQTEIDVWRVLHTSRDLPTALVEH